MLDDLEATDSESGDSWNVYFLTLSDPSQPQYDFGLVKVGITKGAVEQRIANLQTGNPYKIECAASFATTEGRAVEFWVHRTRNLKHLEWLRLPRSEVDSLVADAKRESARLARIAEATARWKSIESNGKVRAASTSDLVLHDRLRGVTEDLWPTIFELSIAVDRIAMLAGRVWRIPGVTQVRRREAFKKFKDKLAYERFPDLVAAHTADIVQGRLLPKGLPTKAAPQWATLRATAEALDRDCVELNSTMLADNEAVAAEGPRTDELSELHERFLTFFHKKTQLEIDRMDLKAQAIDATEQWDGVEGLWDHKRKVRPKFDGKAFRASYRDAAAECATLGRPFIHRHVFFSRSY